MIAIATDHSATLGCILGFASVAGIVIFAVALIYTSTK